MTELPLRGIRVLDITVVWSGPSATRLLAALGAEVIRIESIRHFPTTSRGLSPYPDPEIVANDTGMMAAYPGKVPGPDPYNRFGPFLVTNQGKLGCTMELDTPEGQRAFRRLAEISDVVVENNAWSVSEASSKSAGAPRRSWPWLMRPPPHSVRRSGTDPSWCRSPKTSPTSTSTIF